MGISECGDISSNDWLKEIFFGLENKLQLSKGTKIS